MTHFTDTLPPLANVTSFVRYGEHLGINLLMVLGGFVAGYLVTWLVVRIVFNRVLKKQAYTLRSLLRYVGGVFVAVMIAIFVCEWNLGGPGGQMAGGEGDLERRGITAEAGPEIPPEERSETPEPEKATGEVPDESQVVVRILGGTDDPEGRYYRLDDGEERLIFDQLRYELQERAAREDRPLQRVVIRYENKELYPDQPLVRRVVELARQYNLSVTFPPSEERSTRPR